MRESFKTWTKDDEFEYKLVHKYEEHSPHCSYILVHKITMAASKGKLDLFVTPVGEKSWSMVPNSILLTFHDHLPSKFNRLAGKVAEATKTYKTVVPVDPIKEFVQLSSTQVDEQDAKVEELMGRVNEGEVETTALLVTIASIQQQRRSVLDRLAVLLSSYNMRISKEVQQNEHYHTLVKDELRSLGFVVKSHIEQSDFCLFGKSLPDLYYFYKESTGSKAKVGLLMKLADQIPTEQDSADGHGVVGAIAQFKSSHSDSPRFYAQVFSDLVRVGTLRACDSIMRGDVVDKIVVLGLLASHDTGNGVLVKYYVDLTNDESMFLVGSDITLATGFMAIVQWLDLVYQ